MNSLKFLLLGLALSGAGSAHAQSLGPTAVDAAGASVTSGSLTYEYAVGQAVSGNTLSSSTLLFTPGVLQPGDNTTSIQASPISATDLKIYPNPVESTIFLLPAFSGAGRLQYSLYDVSDRLISTRTVELQSGTERQSLDVVALAAGTYSLRVTWSQAGHSYRSGYLIQKVK